MTLSQESFTAAQRVQFIVFHVQLDDIRPMPRLFIHKRVERRPRVVDRNGSDTKAMSADSASEMSVAGRQCTKLLRGLVIHIEAVDAARRGKSRERQRLISVRGANVIAMIA